MIAAVVGPLALVAQSLFGAPFTRQRLVAINLAQEGIELVGGIRDNNMLCVFNETPQWRWDTDYNGAGSGNDLQGNNRMFDAINSVPVTCSGVANLTFQNPDMPGGDCGNMPLKRDASGRFGYVSGSDTIFARCVTISNPTMDDPGSIRMEDMLDVTSTVSWSWHGISRSVSLSTRLYNWKQP